ncbi:oligoribonuclease, partial [Salmonella enterica]|uniref:oligoribonuclease n=1 Tax=Salmonella enterica TaxID=28901 RepID=UPI00398C779E
QEGTDRRRQGGARCGGLWQSEFMETGGPSGTSPICGTRIGQDRRFLFKYMPELEAYFHYRYLDVSTLKELARRWKPEILAGFTNQGRHHARDDIPDLVAALPSSREPFIKPCVLTPLVATHELSHPSSP